MKRRIGAIGLLMILLVAGLCLPNAYLNWSIEGLIGGSVSISRTSVKPYGENGISRERIQQLVALMNWDALLLAEEPELVTWRQPITGELSNAEALVVCEPFLDVIDTTAAEALGIESFHWAVERGELLAGKKDNQLSFYGLEFMGVLEKDNVCCTMALDAVSGLPLMLGIDLGPVEISEETLLNAVIEQYEKQFNLSFDEAMYMTDYSVDSASSGATVDREEYMEYNGIYPLTGEVYTAKSEDYQLYCEAFAAGERILYLIHLE